MSAALRLRACSRPRQIALAGPSTAGTTLPTASLVSSYNRYAARRRASTYSLLAEHNAVPSLHQRATSFAQPSRLTAVKLISDPSSLLAAHLAAPPLPSKAAATTEHTAFIPPIRLPRNLGRRAVLRQQPVGSFAAGRRPHLSARLSVLSSAANATAKRAQHTESYRSSTGNSSGAGSGADVPPPSSPSGQQQQQQQHRARQQTPQKQTFAGPNAAAPAQQQQPGSTPATVAAATGAPSTAQSPAPSVSSAEPVSAVPSPSTSASSPAAKPTSLATSASSEASRSVEKSDSSSSSSKPKPPLLKRAWTAVKEEAAHYWHGTKLLGKEISISARLVRRLMLGYSLTRREHRQLKRTMADLLRLIPFVPFVIVPFAELLLPVAIKLFPNMLPSTFESKFAEEQKRRGLIKVRLEMAKFLGETIREGGLQPSENLKSKDEFKEFFRKVRSTGEAPSEEDVLRVARLFEDDVTLDNLSRPQLVSVCRYMQINAFGTDNYLRYQIRNRLTKIKQDDMVISSEGIEKLNLLELQKACQDRGIVTANLTDDRLREELSQWIELHLHQRISGTLLILSKAFNFVATGSNEGAKPQLKSLELTLSSLPENLLNEAELSVNKDSATNKQRLEVLQEQEDLIEDEAEQEQEEKAAREAEKERKAEEKARLAKEEEEARALLPEAEVRKDAASEADDAKMTNEQLSELGEALSLLSAKSSVLREREELKILMEEVSGLEASEVQKQLAAESAAEESDAAAKDAKDAAAAASSSAESSTTATGEIESSDATAASAAEEDASSKAAAQQQAARKLSQQSAATRSLTRRVSKMLAKIDQQIEAYDRDVGSRLHIIEASPSGKISVDDLEQALRLIKHRPDEEVLEKLVDKLDVDNDGLIPLQDVLELAKEETGLGILRDEEQDIREQGKALKNEDRDRPIRKQDIVDE